MQHEPKPLRRGWTTGACATAALKAALLRLWGGRFPDDVKITLPRGERPVFRLAHKALGPDWAEAGIIKDAGDDPDVTHGAMIRARVCENAGQGVRFFAGEGVGHVTMPGLPLSVGEPAINPVPREMMRAVVAQLAALHGRAPDVDVTISIPGGAEIAAKTWNPRLGIKGGLSVLGTTGVVRPFSCAAWIASIHRGVDVARAAGIEHVAGCTGATSERVVRDLYGLEEAAMLDMGDFAGGLLKYLRKHPAARLTIGGGIGKMTKLAQGALDLHSSRSQIDFEALADWLKQPEVARMRTALQAYQAIGAPMAQMIAERALEQVRATLRLDANKASTIVDVVIIDRAGAIIGRAG